jgi:hypothetical protein
MSFLMLGSNGLTGNTGYDHTPESVFQSGTLGDVTNYRSNTLHKAQITTNGSAGGSQTVNIKVVSGSTRFVLVSADSIFPKGVTRAYPVTNMTATNVVINNGEFVTLAGYQSTPGGVNNPNYEWAAWLTTDGYANGTWTNRFTDAGTVGNFVSVNAKGFTPALVPPTKVETGYNFHPSVRFTKSGDSGSPSDQSRLVSDNAYSTANKNVTTIIVFKRNNSAYYENIFSFNANVDGNIGWYENNHNLRWYWNGKNTTTVVTAGEGMITLDNANGTTGLNTYLNGTAAVTNQIKGSQNYNSRLAIATNGSTGYGFDGTIQELIVLSSGANGTHLNAGDLQKIHSYLAVKYGMTLTHVNYVNSDDTIVWDRTANAGYNNNIFGIGRDNASGLNQVQSRNTSGAVTVYKGNMLETLNDNNSNAFSDKTFLMLGSNGLTGNAEYIYQAGEEFFNNPISERINYRSNAIHKAQITTNGSAGGNQTVNIKITSTFARYVIVSGDSIFPTGNTRIYPISGLVANNVLINDGEYISLAGYQVLPGGVKNPAYTWLAWLTPDSYYDGTWTNLITSAGNIGDFSRTQSPLTRTTSAPVVTGYNFHSAPKFESTYNQEAPNQMESSANFDISATQSYAMFVVAKKLNNNAANFHNYIISYGAPAEYIAHGLWLGQGNNNLGIGWPSNTARALGVVNPAGEKELAGGVMIVDNPNSANPLRYYINGGGQSTTGYNVVNSNNNTRLRIGSSRNDNDGARPFRGEIQEIIILRKDGTGPTGGYMDTTDVRKIHSYLSIKYGLSMPGNNYLNSAGDTVWNITANAGYNNNIFGIARDDVSGLYQKQSQSVGSTLVTAYVGDTITALNSENTGELADKQYLMIGANSTTPLSALTGFDYEEEYANGNFDVSRGFNVQSPVFKTQLTGAESMNVKFAASSVDYTFLIDAHILVSSDDSFAPETTEIYPLNDRLIEVEINQTTHKYFMFVAFAPGPGGVSHGLKLWLRADDTPSLKIDRLPSSDPKLNGYPDAIADPSSVPVVSEWKDIVREHTYSYAAGAQNNNHLIPVMKYNSPEMNYHPAVRFWGIGNTHGAYLANASGIMAQARPPEHTALFMVNNNFGSIDWVFTMDFGTATANDIYTGPGYGVHKLENGNTVGRFRTNNAVALGTKDLFKAGATSILNYDVKITQSAPALNGNPIRFRFNGQEDNEVFQYGDFNMTRGSQIGKGYNYNRTLQGVMSEVIFFEKSLTEQERTQVESYFALKYGVTLRPNNTPTKRFSYTLSNNDTIWRGEDASGKFVDFYNNIAAVVRDDADRTNNRHSHSTNAGSLLHLGVAGTELSDDGSKVGELKHDLEAIIFGSDSISGIREINNNETCGDFTHIFKRKWMIHKVTRDDRPISMLVGAQDNSLLTIGADPKVKPYYDVLTKENDIFLIVADSPEDIDNNNFRAVIPMSYINGEHQCNYFFTKEDTYITFGYRPNDRGCFIAEEAQFDGTKKFSWTQWTSETNRSSNPQLTLPATPHTSVDLGNNISVTETKVTYPANVKANLGYPRSVNTPVNGSLEVQRRGGAANQDVIITAKFNHPVIPEFSISGLDCSETAYEEVEITGTCSGIDFAPVLSYAAVPGSNSTYAITGNKATVTKKENISGTDRKGMVDVSFQSGVTTVTIKYRTVRGKTGTTQQIYISPINIRAVPPLPPLNADGLAFTKRAKDYYTSTYEPVEYTFEIQNTNCENKLVNLSDTLPEKMKWLGGSISLDAISDALNPVLNYEIIPAVQGKGEELKITGLWVPGGKTLKLKIAAAFDEDAETGEYSNQATIQYEQMINSSLVPRSESSVDAYSLKPHTVVSTTFGAQAKKIAITDTYNRDSYLRDSEIDVIYAINNPNTNITKTFLYVYFSEEFTYKPGSLQIIQESVETPAPVMSNLVDQGKLAITGAADESAGFTLPHGETVIQFTLKTPVVPSDELDEYGQPTEKIKDLFIRYDLSSETDDLSLLGAFDQSDGFVLIPYANYWFTVNGKDYNLFTQDERFCHDNDFVLEGFPKELLGTKTVEWFLNDTEQIASDTGDQTIARITLPDGGPYRVSMVANGTTYSAEFYVGGIPIVWTSESSIAEKQNWNNPDNWSPAEIPSPYHNVFIPGNSKHYPMLTDSAYCNKIYFIQGAELGRPDYLNYNRAYVQMNFGLAQSQQQQSTDSLLVLESYDTNNRLEYSAGVSSPISRERWYMLSSPLHGVVTGDLAFGGYPLTFLMKFGPIDKGTEYYNVGQWTTTYTSMVEPVGGATDGFAYYMFEYDPAGDSDRNLGCDEFGMYSAHDLLYLPDARSGKSFGIKDVNGILELPYFADSTNLYAHRTQIYDNLSNKSKFFSINDGIAYPQDFNKLTGTSVLADRESYDGNYRFVAEEYNNGKWKFRKQINHPVSGLIDTDEFLAGNPYMSSIDVVEFIKDNESSVYPQFRIWNGDAYDEFAVDTESGEVTPTNPGSSPYIAPLQGFLLKYTGTGDVSFNVENISTVRPAETGFNLRSASDEENILRIKAENELAVSCAVIGYKDAANNGFNRWKDVPKLFSVNDYVPEVYSLAGEIPAAINFINNKGEIIVPLGIKTMHKGDIRLSFTGMDNYPSVSKIELIDAKENRTIDLTGKPIYIHAFNHTDTGINNGRFSLRFVNSTTGLPGVNDCNDINIYGNSDGIYVVSSDPVLQMLIFDFQGRKVFESDSGANYYPLQDAFVKAPLVVKVITKNGMKTVKLNAVK